MRLDRFLSETGFGTRTEVKKMIKCGKVTVSDKVVLKPDVHIDEKSATVKVDGVTANYRKFVYLMLNKPAGYVSATWDKKLPTVTDLLTDEYTHFQTFPVGRLDIDTEGLLVLTNDGELSHRLLSPKHHVPKTYIARLENEITEADIIRFEEGVALNDGYVTLPAKLSKIERTDGPWARIIISEGKFHQIKRMFEAIGNRVLYLKRVQMKTLQLDESLNLGEFRELTADEVRDLKDDGK